MKFGTIFTLDAWKNCRDRQDAPAFLEGFREIAGSDSRSREKYAMWKRDPFHPSLGFEERRNNVCVVRIGDHYRALGLREGDTVLWFWIGTHEGYNRFRF
jgi:hypothetical protein